MTKTRLLEIVKGTTFQRMKTEAVRKEEVLAPIQLGVGGESMKRKNVEFEKPPKRMKTELLIPLEPNL